jgi:hypothetical protein
MALDLDSFNRFFDLFVPVYCVLTIVFIGYFVRKQQTESANNENSARLYSFKKKSKTDTLTWRQKFQGTWSKIERKGIYEVNLFSFYFLL